MTSGDDAAVHPASPSSALEGSAVGGRPRSDGSLRDSHVRNASVRERLARAAAVLAAAERIATGPPVVRGSALERPEDVKPRRQVEHVQVGQAQIEHLEDVADLDDRDGVGDLDDMEDPEEVRGDRSPRVPPPADPALATPDADPESVARAIVLRQLTMAPRSRAQLARKLHERGCDDAVAQRVLDRLAEVGLIDDEAYAELLVRARHDGKGLARRALARELRTQGIDQEVADDALRRVGDGDERLRAERLVEQRMRSLHGLPADVQARRLAALLARKGYSGEVAWPVVRDAVATAPEHRRD